MSGIEIQNNDYLTPQEVASILRISVDSVYRMFLDVPGVLVLGNMRNKRRLIGPCGFRDPHCIILKIGERTNES